MGTAPPRLDRRASPLVAAGDARRVEPRPPDPALVEARRGAEPLRPEPPRRRTGRRGSARVERRLRRPPPGEAGHHLARRLVPFGEFEGGAGIIAGLVLPEQGARLQIADADIVGEADQGIELVLARRRAAERRRDLGAEFVDMAGEAVVALLLRPDDAFLDVRPGAAPADRPRI